MSAPTPVFELADHYVERFAALDPLAATGEGIAGHDHEMTDYSPDGQRRARRARPRHACVRSTPSPDRDRRRPRRRRGAARAARARARASTTPASGSATSACSAARCRRAHGVRPDAARHRRRLAGRSPSGSRSCPRALGIDRGRVRRGRRAGHRRRPPPGRRRARSRPTRGAALDADDATVLPRARRRVRRVRHRATPGSRDRARRARRRARPRRTRRSGRFLVEEYAPHADRARPRRRASATRCTRATSTASSSTSTRRTRGDGTSCTASSTRWAQVARAHPARRDRRRSDRAPRARSRPRRSRASTSSAPGSRSCSTARSPSSTASHFDIPEPVQAGRGDDRAARRRGGDVLHGPVGGLHPPGPHVVPDARQDPLPALGRGVDLLPRGRSRAITCRSRRCATSPTSLSRYQRTLAGTSGHAEGWALYAERLMGELGYLDDPAYELGMLRAQAMRAVRVVVDIGMHLELAHPRRTSATTRARRGRPELALPFVIERSKFPADFMASEVDRYLGLPGQAISYKVGERVWLAAATTPGPAPVRAFDLKEFHRARARPRPDGPRPARARARGALAVEHTPARTDRSHQCPTETTPPPPASSAGSKRGCRATGSAACSPAVRHVRVHGVGRRAAPGRAW